MKPSSKAFSLVELLVIIAIIAILAGMLLAVLAKVKISAQVNQAKLEMSQLGQAIMTYDQTYGHFPVSAAAQLAAGTGDFTYGSILPAPTTLTPIGTQVGGNVVSNAEVIAMLMDFTNFPGNPGLATSNPNHVKNPQQRPFLNAKMVSDPTMPGVGPDLVYRDPWGTPYFITMDLNFDGQCNDAFYGQQNMSQQSGGMGYYGLFNNIDSNGAGNHFQFHGSVMVWSAGPDKKINNGTGTGAPANQGANKDNVLNWQ